MNSKLFNLSISPHKSLFPPPLFWQKGKAEDGGGDDEEEVLDEETQKKDQIIKGAIDGLMREYAAELNAPSQDEDSQRRKRKKDKKEEVYQPSLILVQLAPSSIALFQPEIDFSFLSS